MIILSITTSLTWLTVGRNGQYPDENTYTKLTAGVVVGFPCMEETW